MSCLISRLFLIFGLSVSVLATATPRPTQAYTPREAPAAPLDVPDIFSNTFASRMTLANGMVAWRASDDCAFPGEEFPPDCRIYVKPAGGGIERLIYSQTPPNRVNIQSSLASDRNRVYWVQGDGNVVSLPYNASPTSAPKLIAHTESMTMTASEVAIDGNFVYWLENDLLNSKLGKVFRAPKNGGARQQMAAYTNTLRDLRVDGSGSVYYIHRGIVVVIIPIPDILYKLTPTSDTTFNDTLITSTVQGFAIGNDRIYWAERIPVNPNNRVFINSAPLNNLTNVTNHFSLDGTGDPVLHSMAVDSANLYWHENRTAGGGPINRLNLSGTPSEPVPITDNLFGFLDLTSDGRHLFWPYGQIQRLSVNASAITRDLSANPRNMEVIQATQGPKNDVPLVSGKETWVRVYGNILSSSTGETNLSLWPMVELRGTRNGIELPDSPLQPVSNVPIRNTIPDRTLLDNSFLFRLPMSWADGTVTLRATVNPNHVLAETSYENNINSTTVSFQRKSPVCIDIRPVDTKLGRSVSIWTPNVQRFFDRAEQLLPTHELRAFFRGGDALRKPRWYLFDSDPFSVTSNDPDTGWLLFWMNVAHLFSSNLCNSGGITTRVAMLQDRPNREVNGMQMGNSLAFFAFESPAGGFTTNVPGGGVTLAHELGHRYGRGHVDCGNPAGVDDNYPYPPCQMDNVGDDAHIGFDAFTQQLLLPLTTGDLMSYAHLINPPKPRWPSDYNWKKVISAYGNRSFATTATRNTPTASSVNETAFIVTGLITDGVASLRDTYQLAGPLLNQVTAQISDTTEISSAWHVRAYSGTTPLLDLPLSIMPFDESETNTNRGLAFFTRLDITATPSRVEIVRMADNASIGNLAASANPPTVTLITPVAGQNVSDILHVQWVASDPDNDVLHHMVRYSPDNGASWIVVQPSTSDSGVDLDMSALPGGNTALIQIITSDGLRTASATSAPISVVKHAPQASILPAIGDTQVPELGFSAAQSETIVLRGRAYDAEDGLLGPEALTWRITGTVNITGDGNQLTLFSLPPGAYTVTLTAQDADSQQGAAMTHLNIAPKRIFDAAAPTLDGYCDDSAYEADRDPLILRYDDGLPTASQAQVRIVRANDAVFACFSGMPKGSVVTESISLKIDTQNNGGDTQQGDDLVYELSAGGVLSSGHGDGSNTIVYDTEAQHVTGAVSAGDTSWNAELRIDASVFGDWGKRVRMLVSHVNRNSIGDDHRWPRGGSDAVPNTWGLTALGQQSLYLPLLSR